MPFDPDTKRLKSPGPGDYPNSEKPFGSEFKKIRMTIAKKHMTQMNKNPGPGEYDSPLCKSKMAGWQSSAVTLIVPLQQQEL